MRNNKKRGIESLRSRWGFMFITPWVIGICLFFAVPLLQSIWYSFSSVKMQADGLHSSFVGMENYKNVLFVDPEYTNMLKSAVSSISYKLPLIIIVSLIFALLLNQKFRGRLFFRALYFLPVIIATGAVIDLIFKTTSSGVSTGGPESISDSLFSVADIMNFLNLSNEIAGYVKVAINSIFDLVWSCGIQIILFISGLQTIPATVYEACKVEGATKWEQFWFITFPMLGRVTLLVIIFTMVELFTDTRSTLIKTVSAKMVAGNYDSTSAMLWFYFLIVGGVIGLLVLLYNKLALKRWE